MSGPAISVLMPSFNGGEYVIEAVRGAVTQLRDGDELLIQDGKSTDGSMERIAEEFGSYPGVKIVSEPDGGQADALNRALARTTNPVIGWLNADDCIYPGALDAVRAGWVAHPDVDVIYGGWTIFAEDGSIRRICVPLDFSVASLMYRPTVFSGGIFMRAEAVRAAGGFDAELHFCMDLDLVIRLAARGSSAQVPETLAGFRWREGAKTNGMDFGVVREGFRVRFRHARGVRGYAEAVLGNLAQVVAYASTPLRRSDWYSRLRVKRAEKTRSVPAR